MKKNRLYLLISAMTLLSYGWLFFNFSAVPLNVCFFKHFTSLACPACGTTQSVLSLAQGNLQAAIMANPLGLLAAALLLVMPIWLILDLLRGKSTLNTFYLEAERHIKNKYVAAPLIILVLLNWAWNLIKNG